MKRMLVVIAALGLFLFAQTAQADWTPAKRLTWNSDWSGSPAIATDSSGHLHVVWSDGTPGNDELYYKRSTDGGTNWGAARRLTWTSGYSILPDIAIDSGDSIHVVWRDNTTGDNEIYYKRSSDGGTIWSVVKSLTSTSGLSTAPAITIDTSDTIEVVWSDDPPGNHEIYYQRSTDGGTAWSAARRLTWTSKDSSEPVIAVDPKNNIHVAWYDYTPGAPEIYYKRSMDGGKTWDPAQRLTWTSLYCGGPDIAIDSNNAVHVVWHDYRVGAPEIYYKRSPDGGTTWSAAQRLTWISGDSYGTALAIDSNMTIHLVWQDNTSGNFEINYKNSPDGGSTWSAAQRLTGNEGHSQDPAIVVDSGGTIHVVWSDNTPGNSEIYYKNGKQSP